ncbi:MAG: Trm112 family protein [Geobacteraceae bacterium]|nr:Trm112 family protein [Geobacteraceae bacterium]
MISKDLLDILACPVCNGTLETAHSTQSLRCLSCGMEFPIRDGIPILLVSDESEPSGE